MLEAAIDPAVTRTDQEDTLSVQHRLVLTAGKNMGRG